LCDTDHFDSVYAVADLPESGLCHQQVWRSSLSSDSRLKVYTLPGTQDTGTCAIIDQYFAVICRLFSI